MFDIAGSTVEAGPAIFSHGKLDIAFMAEYTGVQHSVRLAADDLRLDVVCEHTAGKGEYIWICRLQDDLKSTIEVTVERRTLMLCRCRVDVGFFGAEPTAQLIMTRIAAHLPQVSPATTKP